MIWRTGALGRFVGALAPAMGAIETSCFHVAANPRRFCGSPNGLKATLGDSRLFYPSRRHKPMVRLSILMVRANAAPGFLLSAKPVLLAQAPPHLLEGWRPTLS